MKTFIFYVLAMSSILTVGCTIAEGTATPAVSSNTSSVQIRIVSPRDSAIVPAGSNTVQVAVENMTPNEGGSWGLYLDGVLISTAGSGALTSTIPISVSGPHEIKAILTDAKNVELASSAIEVTAAPETPTASPFNLPWVGPVMAVFVVGVLAMIGLGLRITREKKPA